MDDFNTTLVSLGLTETEAALYLAGIRYPSVGVHELVKETGIKRPTVYHALGTLKSKGLSAEHGTGGKLKFVMCPPEQLMKLVKDKRNDLDKQEEVLNQFIPFLKQVGLTEDVFTTAQYEGIEGIKTAVDIALYCKSRTWEIIAPVKNFFSEFDKEYAQYYLHTRKRKGITSRTLWEEEMRPGRKLTPEDAYQRKPRIMPKSMHGKLKSVLIIFDDKVAIISSLEKLSAVVITSQEVHDMFSAMFNGLWEISKEY